MTEQILNEVANLVESGGGGGARRNPTFTLTWSNATNPEKWVVPRDLTLVAMHGNSLNVTRILSRDGRTSVANPGMSGVGGGLVAITFGISLPDTWEGFAKLRQGDELWYGGTSTSMLAYLVFEESVTQES